jgi:NAD(P)H-dependent FMN reductase
LKTLRAVAPEGVTTVLYEGLSDLPAFNPDGDGERPHAAVADLRQQLAASDAVLFCTPEYAGTLPGSLKNLLDWTVGSGELYGKPVAWINVANSGRGEGARPLKPDARICREARGHVDERTFCASRCAVCSESVSWSRRRRRWRRFGRRR